MLGRVDQMNQALLDLCHSLPEPLQNRAAMFLMQRSRTALGQGLDFIKLFYSPAWTPVVHICKKEKTLSEQDLNRALQAQTMALLLHLVDDYLVDHQEQISHMMLQLRTQAWSLYEYCLDQLAGDSGPSMALKERLINRYFLGIQNTEPFDSLEAYLETARKQTATWAAAPALLLLKAGKSSAAEKMVDIYENFFLAWRVMDDLQDRHVDDKAGIKAAYYYAAADRDSSLYQWDSQELEKNLAGLLEDQHLFSLLLDRTKDELKKAGMKADAIELHELVEEFSALAMFTRG